MDPIDANIVTLKTDPDIEEVAGSGGDTAEPESAPSSDMLSSFLAVANFVSGGDGGTGTRATIGDSDLLKKQLGDWLQKAERKISSMEAQLKASRDENQQLKQEVEKNKEENRKLKHDIDCERWEMLDLKSKLEQVKSSSVHLYKSFKRALIATASEQAASGTVDVTIIQQKVQKVQSEMEMKLGVWKKSQEAVEAELFSMTASFQKLLPFLPQDLSVQFVDDPPPPPSSDKPRKKKVRFSLEQDQSQANVGEDNTSVNEPEIIVVEPDEEVDIDQLLDLDVSISQSQCSSSQIQELEEVHGHTATPPENAEDNPDGSKIYWCLCGKGYSKRNDLSRHVLSREMGKIFKCQFCSKTFTLHKSVKRHVRESHDVEYTLGNYGCRACGQTFHAAKALYQHRKTEHPGAFQIIVDPSPEDVGAKKPRRSSTSESRGGKPRRSSTMRRATAAATIVSEKGMESPAPVVDPIELLLELDNWNESE